MQSALNILIYLHGSCLILSFGHMMEFDNDLETYMS